MTNENYNKQTTAFFTDLDENIISFDLWDDEYAVMCVKHAQEPEESIKMDGKLQQPYPRKNWSSFMLMKPSMCNITYSVGRMGLEDQIEITDLNELYDFILIEET